MSEPRNQPAVAPLDVGRIVDLEHVGHHRPTTLIDASLFSATSINHTMTAIIQPQIDGHSAAIAAAQGQIGTQGEAIAGARVQLEENGKAIATAQGQISTHADALARASAQLLAHNAAIATAQGHIHANSNAITGANTKIEAQHAAITAAQGQIGAQGEAIASTRTQVSAHSAAIATAQAHIKAQGESLSRAQARLDAQHATLTGMQTHLTDLAATTGRHEHAIAVALLGEEGHIRRLGLELAELAERVSRLEESCKGDRAPTESVPEDQTRAMREANEALRERVAAMEAAIRELVEHGPGPQGGGPRSRQQR